MRAKKSSVNAAALNVKICCEDATTAELIVAMRGGSDERGITIIIHVKQRAVHVLSSVTGTSPAIRVAWSAQKSACY